MNVSLETVKFANDLEAFNALTAYARRDDLSPEQRALALHQKQMTFDRCNDRMSRLQKISDATFKHELHVVSTYIAQQKLVRADRIKHKKALKEQREGFSKIIDLPRNAFTIFA